MRAGRLRHRLTLHSKTETRDSYGASLVSWTKQGTVWGAIEPLSGREFFAQQQTQSEASVRIVMRYYSGIDETWRISSGGKYYDIETIINDGERDRMLTLMCRQGVSEDFGDITTTGPWPNVPPAVNYLLLETGDNLVLEDGSGNLILEG